MRVFLECQLNCLDDRCLEAYHNLTVKKFKLKKSLNPIQADRC